LLGGKIPGFFWIIHHVKEFPAPERTKINGSKQNFYGRFRKKRYTEFVFGTNLATGIIGGCGPLFQWTPGETKNIKDGNLLKVDGTNGIVKILEEA
jgi:hypothetical protein